MSQPRRRPRISFHLSRCLFGLLMGFLFLGSPPSVAAQTCAENSTAVNNRGAALATDCSTLLGLKDTLRGTQSLNWATSLNMDSWTGITVAGTPARVTKLVATVTGSIPAALGSLDALTEITLTGNLTGSIPKELGSLTNLTKLDLSFHFLLTGSIPKELGNLTSLTELNLSICDLTGSIPKELGNLTSLTKLDLSWNRKLTGSIPKELGSLTNLTTFNLSWSNLTGTIPPELGNLTNLTSFPLQSNQLTGAIPGKLGDLTALTNLNLSGNQLTGSIPSELGSLTALTTLNLYDNQLTSIPSELGSLTALTRLSIANNQLTGSIPSQLNNLTELQFLFLNNNQLSGSIPTLSALTKLKTLSLYDNQLSGSIPALSTLTALTTLNLYDNQLSGTFPTLSALTSLRTLNLSNNSLTGSPALSALTSLTTLDLSNNSLSGTFPTLSALSALTKLDLSDNAFTAGAFPTLHSSVSTKLKTLALRKTNRNGTFPTLSGYSVLEHLDLSGNSGFTASAFPTLNSGVNSKLKTLALGKTNRIGTFPTLSSYSVLEHLDLSDNAFNTSPSGAFPTLHSSVSSTLKTLALRKTNRSGAFPDLSDYSALEHLDLGDNAFDAGGFPTLHSSVNSTLTHLDLSSTTRTGPFPDLSALTKLTYLDLSHNAFTASAIPAWVSALADLTHLDLSDTARTGTLPTDLNSPTCLTYLDLSDNRLTGTSLPWSGCTGLTLDLANNPGTFGLAPPTCTLNSNTATGNFAKICATLLGLKSTLRGTAALNWDAATDMKDWDGLSYAWGPVVNKVDLRNKQLDGTIPPALGRLGSVQLVYLSHNQLTGPIPKELGNLGGGGLVTLELNNNQLTGPIPKELGNLDLSSVLDLSHNQLTGPIPRELGNLVDLQRFDLSHNQLSGSIPEELGYLGILQGTLETLNLSHNQLTGSIPKELANLDGLSYLYLSHNQLTGPIPEELELELGKPDGNLDNLAYMYLSHNQLTGPLPDLSGLRLLRELDLSNNPFAAGVGLPNLHSTAPLETLRLRNTNRTGAFPDLSRLYSLKELDLSDNAFAAGDPEASWTLGQSNLRKLNLRNTNRTGPFPGVSSGWLEYLDLSDNPFTAGAAPSWLNNKTGLTHLNLRNTNRTGTFPTLSALSGLTHLDLSGNAFTAGAFPTLHISVGSKLKTLALRNANRNGAFPTLSGYSKLEHLDLSGNSGFTAGTFPDLHDSVSSTLKTLALGNTNRNGAFPDLSDYSALEYLDLGGNSGFTGGAFPTLHSSVNSTLTHLDLSSTQRTGAFPDLSALTRLTYLDLSDNAFTAGTIPAWVSALAGLTHLDLSATGRTGTIPTRLGSLRSLTHLDLSNNQLTGSRPSGLNRSNLVLRLGSNTSTFGLTPTITVAKNTDTTLSSGFTFDPASNPCGSVADGTSLPTIPTLREALIWANHTSGAETINFGSNVHGQTLTPTDGSDTDTNPDPLPALCGGRLTLEGDIDADGTPDITLDGTGLPSDAAGLTVRSSNNTITGFTITGGAYGIVVQAGSGTTAGTVSNTTIRGNTVSDTDTVGIAVFTEVAGSTISRTTIEQNEVYENDGHGIAAWSEAVNTTRTNSITGLKILDNHVHDHTAGAGIRVTSGYCEADYNRLQATISGNTLSTNGQAATFADIEAGAALTDSDCTGTPTDTTQNRLEVTITDNVSEDTPDIGIAVYGGVKSSDTNTVTATVARNAVWRSATAGISVTGGKDSSDSNTVTATINDNLIVRTTKLTTGTAGHGLVLVAAAAEPAESTSSDNTLTVKGQGNIISLARNNSDTSHYDILRQRNNNASNPTRTGNTLTDSLTGMIFDDTKTSDDGTTDDPFTPLTALTPVTVPKDHRQVEGYTFTPASAPAGAGMPSNIQFSVSGQVFNIRVQYAGEDFTRRLFPPVQVCLPIPAGVSAGQAYILRYNDTTHTWERLTEGRTTADGQVCATVAKFSLFTVGNTGGGSTGGTGGGGGGDEPEPAPAPLQNALESPAPGAAVSGIDLIRGWSFSEAAQVGIEQVELYLDGQRAAVIPCCSTRPDVAGAFPDFPHANTSRSGWGITQNWGNLTPGSHTVQVVVTGTDEGRWASEQRAITVVKPGGIAFADQFSLAEAEARLENGQVVLDGVVLRDKVTQVEQEIVARYAWQTGAQGLRLVTSQPLAVARTQPVGVERLLARVLRWGQRVLSPASVTANDGIMKGWEAPEAGEAVAGVRLIQGWAFPEEATDAIASVTVDIGDTRQEDAPCCSTRPDVVGEFPDQANAELSGWGLVFNYGNLPEGEHALTVHIETEAGIVAAPETRTVTVSRLGGYAFVDRFDLSGAEVDLVGEELILSGVVVRDSQTQETQAIEVRLRWSAATQGLVIVGTEILP